MALVVHGLQVEVMKWRLEIEMVDLCQKRGGELTLSVDGSRELVVVVLSGLDRVVEVEYD